MNKEIFTLLSIMIILAVLVIAGCASTVSTTSVTTASTASGSQEATATQADPSQAGIAQSGNTASNGTAASGNPPSGSPPGGAPPSGSGTSGSSSSDGLATATGAYTLDGQNDIQTGQAYSAASQDQSAVYVKNGGDLTLTNATITTSGNTSSNDNSSFYGLNAAVLATDGSTITMSESTISTTGSGANGAFATGSGSMVSLNNVTINATGDGGHGAMASDSGSLNLTNVTITTSGAHSAPIATDRGGGTITVSGSNVTTNGTDSPCLYSTGNFTVDGLTCTGMGSESAVIEGANTISLTNSTLTSSVEDKWGVMIYQSMSGDAQGSEGTFTMTGGNLANTAKTGPLFFVTNSTAYITLKGVKVNAGSGVLVQAAATDRWGTSGSNGGTVDLTADGQTLSGDLEADNLSSLTINLQNDSTLEGAINSANTAKQANLSLDSSSSWTVTSDSYLTCLSDTSGISGTSITNITGNGHTVYYNANACSELNGLTYSLAGGGSLTPSK